MSPCQRSSSTQRAIGAAQLSHYAQELATRFHGFYRDCRVVSSDPADDEISKARLRLCEAARIVLARVLGLMGVPRRIECKNRLIRKPSEGHKPLKSGRSGAEIGKRSKIAPHSSTRRVNCPGSRRRPFSLETFAEHGAPGAGRGGPGSMGRKAGNRADDGSVKILYKENNPMTHKS